MTNGWRKYLMFFLYETVIYKKAHRYCKAKLIRITVVTYSGRRTLYSLFRLWPASPQSAVQPDPRIVLDSLQHPLRSSHHELASFHDTRRSYSQSFKLQYCLFWVQNYDDGQEHWTVPYVQFHVQQGNKFSQAWRWHWIYIYSARPLSEAWRAGQPWSTAKICRLLRKQDWKIQGDEEDKYYTVVLLGIWISVMTLWLMTASYDLSVTSHAKTQSSPL